MKLPNLEIGDVVMIGKSKNRVATIQDFGTDEHGQPTVITDKGVVPVFKFRLAKLMTKGSTMPFQHIREVLAVPYYQEELDHLVDELHAGRKKLTDIEWFLRGKFGSEIPPEARQYLNKKLDEKTYSKKPLHPPEKRR